MSIEKNKQAGKILTEAMAVVYKNAVPGARLIDLANDSEAIISEKGAGNAFPINLSINEIAAHYTPSIDDETKLTENDVLKIDIGVHVDGFIADAAITKDLSGKYTRFVEAVELGLAEGIKLIAPGVPLQEYGQVVQDTIESFDLHVVDNLSGHTLGEYLVHAGNSIPNTPVKGIAEFEEGSVLALEPFATDGKGYVRESAKCEIFSVAGAAPLRNREARVIFPNLINDYNTLPFAERWVAKNYSKLKLKMAFRELMMKRMIRPYPALTEKKGKIVSQAEDTVVVTSKGVEKITDRTNIK
ncbi:MAG: type II methionyl aminopeptidase [Candidatus Diapherotrites archaeon]|nr:type II methionyl aminopeptidase [Candidatus Diapherotrites archaeon]